MSSKQKCINITTESDYDELKKAYQFVLDTPSSNQSTNNPESTSKSITSNSETRRYKNDDRNSIVGSSKQQNHQSGSSTWQDRMVQYYHSHLYKTYVIADLTHYKEGKIGLRWRVKQEVLDGKGVDTCGNKHCPCYFENNNIELWKNNDITTTTMVQHTNVNNQQDQMITTYQQQQQQQTKIPISEVIRSTKTVSSRKALDQYYASVQNQTISKNNKNHSSVIITNNHTSRDLNHILEKEEKSRLHKVPFGIGLCDYQVHFAYQEQGKQKQELVKLKLCLRCAPLLFYDKGGALGAQQSRIKLQQQELQEQHKQQEKIGISESSIHHLDSNTIKDVKVKEEYDTNLKSDCFDDSINYKPPSIKSDPTIENYTQYKSENLSTSSSSGHRDRTSHKTRNRKYERSREKHRHKKKRRHR